MKLKFKNQDFQTAAVKAVCDLFSGQEKQYKHFTLSGESGSLFQKELGQGNALLIDDEIMLKNLQAVQKRHHLPLSQALGEKQFCVEMETGTGKTYVYTKTILELNRLYGFTKFIIVVPSVAIREGVLKSLQITDEHFSLTYSNVPRRYFIYNSARLSDVRQFAASPEIEIMIINIDAFRKSENVINQAQDRLNGQTAMRYIQDTSPIVIIDEPQSVDNTPKAKEAIASLNPLAVLRYSATHREKINTVYRLTPVDAYQMGLVKQICVSSNQVSHAHNKPYIRLVSVKQDGGFRAKVEIDVQAKGGAVKRKTLTVKPGDDFFILSGERDLYQGYKLSGIDCTPEREAVEFENNERLRLGQTVGGLDENIIKRAQIKRTIEAHLEKELLWHEQGIKVLSLFFIDEVKKYRDENGRPGPYAVYFEESYEELMSQPRFSALRNITPHPVGQVHDGYFSQDKKGVYKNTKGDSQDDYSTYNTIMKDKEWLLSFDCPLRFIFSHSALKEGWDNPNVFQVCTLIDQKSTFTCRQKVGRGLRLCVDQSGERIEDKNVNLLHVMANESFAEFAETLQKEIEAETGHKFGVLELSHFIGQIYEEKREVILTVTPELAQEAIQSLENHGYLDERGQATPALKEAVKAETFDLPPEIGPLAPLVQTVLESVPEAAPIKVETLTGQSYTATVIEEKTVGYDDANELIKHFEKKEYISKTGQIKNTMKAALLAGTLDLPQKFEAARDRFVNIIQNADNRPKIRDAAKEVKVRLNKEAFLSPEFLALWDKIKQKTAYHVKIDNRVIVERCIEAILNMDPVPLTRLVSQHADIHIEKPGVSFTERSFKTVDIEEQNLLPHILKIFQEECGLPLPLSREILLKSGRISDLFNNPQLFIERCVALINQAIHGLEIDGIRYAKLAGQEYYLQEIFEAEELLACLDQNAVPVEHSVYDHVIYDSETVERPFAQALDNDPEVKMFFKLPSKFKIDTPLGSYNPDWAVYLEQEGAKKLYFVLETKGSLSDVNLRLKESLKIKCGQEHFKALGDEVGFKVAKSWKDFRVNI